MNDNELRALVERMVAELAGQQPTPQVKAADYKPMEREADRVAHNDSGEGLPDITQTDIRQQYLIDNPKNKEAYLDLKRKTPARIGLGRAGARYKTITQLRMRADPAAAQDSVFSLVDEEFPKRAKALGGGVILGGVNYGQGSSREHAALVPMYLGIKAVIAKSFARIHAANLINFGITPVTLVNADDYDKMDEGDEIEILGFADALKNKSGMILENKTKGIRVPLSLSLTARQREILLAGGLLNYTKNNS